MVGSRITYRAVAVWLTERVGLFGARASALRVVAWTLVFLVVLSQIFAPGLSRDDRGIVADVPPSDVRYVAPVASNDLAGFLAPPARADRFNLAWVGGSEVKLNEVSLPAEFRARVSTVGGRPLVIDTYSIIGMRVLDTYRAVLAAIDNDADAIVVALNPTFTRDEWALVEWRNLDVSDTEALIRDRRTWSWFWAFTSPSDVAYRLGVGNLALVRDLSVANRRQRDWVDRLDLLDHGPDAGSVPEGVDPRLPGDATTFWLDRESDRDGRDVADRIAGIVEGFGIGGGASASILLAMIDQAAAADIPIYLYPAALSPAYLDDPRYVDVVARIEVAWQGLAALDDHANVTIETGMLSREFDRDVTYFDPIHTTDAGALADVLVGRLCAQWAAVNTSWECDR